MAALALVPKVFNTQGLVPKLIQATLATTADWINIPNCRGVLLPAPVVTVNVLNNASPSVATTQYGLCYSTAAYATVTTTSIAIDNALADATNTRLVPYYILNGTTGEIMEVTGDTTPAAATSTLTIRRGCLGTTASAIADNDRMVILNQIVVTNGTNVGILLFQVFTLPEDPGAICFA